MRRLLTSFSATTIRFTEMSSMTLRSIASATAVLHGPKAFQPFSESDELELVKVLSTKPKHVARRIRLMAQSNRRKVAQFRNTVTYLMILMQTKLQKKELTPDDATIVLEGVLRECVHMKQSDMAHLLFRAALRFRKYGMRISPAAVQHLFEAYKGIGAKELLKTLADEMKADEELRPLAMLAYAYASHATEALELRHAIGAKITAIDLSSLVVGLFLVGANEAAMEVVNQAFGGEGVAAPPQASSSSASMGLTPTEVGSVASAGLVALDKVPLRQATIDLFDAIYKQCLDRGLPLTDAAVGAVCKRRLRNAASVSDVYESERAIKAELQISELGMTASTIVIAKLSDLVARGYSLSDDAMLVKIQHLQAIVEGRAAAGDFDSVEPVHLYSLFKGYGVLGKVEEMTAVANFIKEHNGQMDTRMYDEMIRWHAHHQNVKEVLAVKTEMEEKNIPHTSMTYVNIFNVLYKFYPHLIKRYYDEMRQKGIHIDPLLYARVLKTFADVDEKDFVAAIYAEMKAKEVQGMTTFHVKAIQPLLKSFANDPAKADEVIADAGRRGYLTHPTVQAAVIRHYSRLNRHDDIARLVGSIPGKTIQLYCALLNHRVKVNDKDGFIELFAEMRRSGVSLNSLVYLTAIKAFSKWRDSARVTMIIDEARAANVLHDDKFLVAIFEAFSVLNDVEAMDKTWQELRHSTLPISMTSYNRLLDLYQRRNNIERMQEILAHMMERIPANPVTTTTVIDMLGKMGKLSEMESLLDEMAKSEEVAPTQVTYHQAMAAYAKSGDVHKMEEMRSRLVGAGHKENHITFNILVDGYGRAKRFEHIADLLHERKSKGIAMDEIGYITLLNIYSRARMGEELHNVVDQLLQSKAPLSSRVISSLATAFSFIGDEAKVDHYVGMLLSSQNGARQRDVENVFLIYSRMRNTTKMRELLGTVKSPSEFVFNTCVAAFAKAGDHAAVADLLQQMDERKMSLHTNTSITLSSLLLKAGKVELAQAVLKWKRHDVPEEAVDPLAVDVAGSPVRQADVADPVDGDDVTAEDHTPPH